MPRLPRRRSPAPRPQQPVAPQPSPAAAQTQPPGRTAPSGAAGELAELAQRLLEEVRDARAGYAELDAALGRLAEAGAPVAPGAAGAHQGAAARLVAVELVRAGRSREDVEAYLQSTFGFAADPALLDDVFATEQR